MWEVYQDVGAKEAIHIICGYRSPDTNSMLRRRSKGVARFSQHTLGKAIDFYIPGVPLEKLARHRHESTRAVASAIIRPPARRSCISTSAASAPGRA